MKRVIAVQHADGITEFECPECGSYMISCDTTRSIFSKGEYSETGGEYLFCQNCGTEANPPKAEYENLEDELLYHCWPVLDEHEPNRCPECGSTGKCIINEKMIDVRVRIMSCTMCDSFWKVLGK